ncbi:VanZ family protein [Alteribacter natronophilus]|uniref:VanZ family protein n=1 Tax=Alteribacter natronophilus TaxID=2583810 RepID=UPI00110D8551|nr:VanZ family protein [Alteribacter natronophilus]TMW72224.1 VanZ family protein [Alteribacter natronophilus]
MNNSQNKNTNSNKPKPTTQPTTNPKSNTLLTHYTPLLAWTAMIHYASSMPASDQSLNSPLAAFDLTWIERTFSWVSFQYGNSVVSLDTRTTEQFAEFFIRKGAHVFVYAVLAILAYRVAKLWLTKPTQSPHTAILAIAFITIYATYDEITHYYHPGRSGLIEDVLLDMAGGALGILSWYLLEQRRRGKTDKPPH